MLNDLAPPPYTLQALPDYKVHSEPASAVNNSQNENELLAACRNGNLSFLEKSSELKNEINYLFESKEKDCPFYRKSISLLHLACRNKNLEIVNFLLNMGASVDTKTTTGVLPIHLACTSVKEAQSELCVNNVYNLVQQLLKYHLQDGWDIDQIYKVGSSGSEVSLLTLACQSGNEGAVRALLDNGADPNGNKSCHKKPLHVLCDGKEVNERILTALFRANANLNTTFQGATPLHQLCSHQFGNKPEQIKATTALINYGSDVLAKNKKGWQAIHCAAESGNHKLIELLLETGKVDVNARVSSSRYSLTPVHMAALSECHSAQKEETLKFLLRRGANIELRANVNPCKTCDEVCEVCEAVTCFCCNTPRYRNSERGIPVKSRAATRIGATCCPGLCTVSPFEIIEDPEMRVRVESVVAKASSVINQQPTA